MSNDPAGRPESFDERLARLAEELWGVGEGIGDPDVGLDAGEAADSVHSITTSAAHTLRALGDWYQRHAEEIFDERRGAEHDATKLAQDAGHQLRAFAAELEGVAERYLRLIAELDQLGHRDFYELAFSELDDEEQYYAVVEVDYSRATDEILRPYARVDVARYFAREFARRGTPGNVYRVVPIIDGERETHVAQWPGEGDRDE